MINKTKQSTHQRRISKQEYKYLLSQLAQLLVLAPNSIFKPKDIAKPILKASIDNIYIESVCNHMRGKDKSTPTGDDVFYHITGKRLKIHDVYACIDSMIKRSLIKARKYINTRIPLPIAIDFTEIPYYGEDKGEIAKWIIGCKNKRGTNKCFKFITAHVVIKGRRFTIAAIPVTVFDNTPDLLERIIRNVRKYITIQYIFLDRGFYAVSDIKKLNGLDSRFVMPPIKYNAKNPEKDILQLMRKHYNEGKSRFTYTLGTKNNNVTITVVVKKDEKDEDVVGFVTNTKLPAKTIGEWYRKRWGIETGYRVKEAFRSRTCARRSYTVRLLLNMLSFALYNIWALTNITMRVVLRNGRFLKNNRSDITAYELCKEFEDLIIGIP